MANNKYVVRYVIDDDPRSQEAIMLASSKDDAQRQLVNEFIDVNYVRILDVSTKTVEDTRKKAESFFI